MLRPLLNKRDNNYIIIIRYEETITFFAVLADGADSLSTDGRRP